MGCMAVYCRLLCGETTILNEKQCIAVISIINKIAVYLWQYHYYLSKIHVKVLLEKGLLHTFSIPTFVDVQFLHEFVVLSVIREG